MSQERVEVEEKNVVAVARVTGVTEIVKVKMENKEGDAVEEEVEEVVEGGVAINKKNNRKERVKILKVDKVEEEVVVETGEVGVVEEVAEEVVVEEKESQLLLKMKRLMKDLRK